jgi:hypothetical protein
MRVEEHPLLMTNKTAGRRGLFEGHVRRVSFVFDGVTRSASLLEGGMNMISFDLVGVAFQAL